MVFDSDAIPLVLGVRQKKGPFYGAMEKSISGHQDDSFHKERRKVWDMAFRECKSRINTSWFMIRPDLLIFRIN